MKYLYPALILIFFFFAGSGIAYHGFRIYEKYTQKGKTTYSFDLYQREDGTGYMKYGSDDFLACKILVSE